VQRCDIINNLSVITFFKERHTGLFASRLTSPITTQALRPQLHMHTHTQIHICMTWSSSCTYSSANNTMKCAHPFFDKQTSHTTQVHAEPQLGANDSPTYMYIYIYTWCQHLTKLYVKLQMGFMIRDITFPSPLFMHYSQCIIYTCTYKSSKKFKKMRILCPHSISHSQVASLRPYQVHWTFTNSMTQFHSYFIL
jgi:hypothetical protein